MAMNRGSMRKQITKGPMKKKVGLYNKGKKVRVVSGNKNKSKSRLFTR
tara:strand:+ start:463 stop:606 length:144 start_codon:yes stop_codon:yes gene_type:complete